MRCTRCGHTREADNLTHEGRPWAIFSRARPGGPSTSGVLCPWCDIKLDKFLALELRDEDEQEMERAT